MTQHHFRAELWLHSSGGPGSWHFLTLPTELAEDLVDEVGPRSAFGSIRVDVRIGATSWRTSLFPDSARRSLLLPVKAQVRRAEDLRDGTECRVTLEVVE